MTIAPKSFRYERDEAASVATITLDRPDRLNALTFEVYEELAAVFRRLDREEGVRAVVLTGAGRAFCSGGDVEDIIGRLLDRTYEELLAFTRATCELVLAIRECRRPVVAALNGTVAGAGAVIATACDFRIAGPDARIAYLFTKVGLSGADMGASWLLPRMIGNAHATELLMLGDFIGPERAAEIGLFHRVVAADEVAGEARKLAEKLARGPSFALEITKDALNREASMDLWTAFEHEGKVQAACMMNPNFREAYEAFVAKRKAEFR